MSDYDDSGSIIVPEDKLKGGSKKKSNGHKANCKCPICKNMKMKKGGSMQELRPANFVGGKKANGHKATCKCPICVNMKHQMASKKNRRVTRSKRTRRGGANGDNNNVDNVDDVDNEEAGNFAPQNLLGQFNNIDNDDDVAGPAEAAAVAGVADAGEPAEDAAQGGKKKRKGNGHKPNCKCPICKNMKMKKGGADDDSSDSDSSSSSDSSSDSDSDSEDKPKNRKGNGHKETCMCPICKNMKKGGVGPYDDDNKEQQNPNTYQDLEMGSDDPRAIDYQDKRSKIKPRKPQPKPADGLPRPFTVGKGGSRRRKSRKTRKTKKSRKIRRRR
jgi:hypothetical protein